MLKSLALITALVTSSALGQEAKPVKPHVFFDKYNVALFSADALVRSLDAQSTRSFMTNKCACMTEKNLPLPLAKSTAGMYAYSLGVSASVMGLSYLAHKTHHHKLERLIPMVDAGYDLTAVIGNYKNISKYGK